MVSICRIYTQTFVHVGLISGASRFAVWSKGGGGRAGKRQFPRFQVMEKSEEEIKKKKTKEMLQKHLHRIFPESQERRLEYGRQNAGETQKHTQTLHYF